jgi:hypothetical protein
MKSDQTVIFVSNPFGFGPTGKTMALVEELSSVWPGNIVYAASPMCQELLPEHLKGKIIIENIDERNEESLRLVYSKYHHPLVVCTLNRLAIKTAKSMGLTAFFVDSLAWMWKEIPTEYLLADHYYCFNLFGLKDRLPKKENIRIIAPVFGKLPKYKIKKDPFTLFHIGGFKNPFQDKLSYSFLNLLVDSFQKCKVKEKIIVTGGHDAIMFMEDKVKKSNYRFCTFGRDEFLNNLNSASHFITTSGLTATLEAFALRTPTSFMPPTNLSQWKILKLLTAINCADSRIDWQDVLGYEINFEDMTEIEAVPLFHRLATEAETDINSHSKFVTLINQLMTATPDISSQTGLIKSAGIDGSTTIVKDIVSTLG